MNHETQIKNWLEHDEERLRLLEIAADLNLNDWCLAAGFLRNMVWDRLHGTEFSTPLNDIDLIHYDTNDTSEKSDKEYESILTDKINRPWSVKNQARMHLRNNDIPYLSTCDAMSYWVEIETAIGVRLRENREIEIVAPFGLESLFEFTVTLNAKRPKLKDFEYRINSKGWLRKWPRLIVSA